LPQTLTPTIYVKNVTINPTIINQQTAINCSAIPYSALGGDFNVTFEWYKNGILQPFESNITNVANNTVAVSSIIPVSSLFYGDNWTCSARSQQSVSYSAWVNSSRKTVAGVDDPSCLEFNNYLNHDLASQPYITIGDDYIKTTGSVEIKNNCNYTVTTAYNITNFDANATCSNIASDCSGTIIGLENDSLANVTVKLRFPMVTTNVLLNTTIFYKSDINNKTTFHVFSTKIFNITNVSVQIVPTESIFQFFACQDVVCPLVVSSWTPGITLSAPYTYTDLQITSGYLSYVVSQAPASGSGGGGGGGECPSGQILCDGICVVGTACPTNNQTNDGTITSPISYGGQTIIVGSGNGTIQTPQVAGFLEMITANLLRRANVSCVINNDNSIAFLISLIMCEATGLLSMSIGNAIWLWIIIVGILIFLIYDNITKKRANWGIIVTYGGALFFIFVILILNKISLNAIG